MSFTQINNKAEFEAAVNVPDKFVFVFVYENEIPEGAKEAAAANVGKHPNVGLPYALDINTAPEAREHIKASKYPVLILFKDGKEVAKVEEPDEEKAKVFKSFIEG